MDLLWSLPGGDPRAALKNAEQHLGFRATPSALRQMAQNAREEAQRLDDAAARAHNRADVYEDMATQREGGA